MADETFLFGFLDDLVGINFPGKAWLVIEGVNDPLYPGTLSWYSWNAPSSVPTPAVSGSGTTGATGPHGATSPFLVNSVLNNPTDGAYLNVKVPAGPTGPAADPNPALNFTGGVPAKNAAWTYPRPSFLATGAASVQGVAFFNLRVLAPGGFNGPAAKPFQMQLVEGLKAADVSGQWSVRGSIWKNMTDFKRRVTNGAITNFGPLSSTANGVPTIIPGAVAQTTLTGRFDGTAPNIFVTATDKYVTLRNPGTTGPVVTTTLDVILSLTVIDASGAIVGGTTFSFFTIAAKTSPPTLRPQQQSGVTTVGDRGNRVDNFSSNFTLSHVPSSAQTFWLGMQVAGSAVGAAGMTIDHTSQLTIVTRPSVGPPTTKTYTLDPNRFPFGSLFSFANTPVSYPGSSVQYLFVGIAPQADGTFSLGYDHPQWLPAWPT